MAFKYLFLSSAILALLILLPLCLRLRIKLRSGIVGSIYIAILAASLIYFVAPEASITRFQIIIVEVTLIVGLALVIGLFKFYRDPERRPPEEKNIIVSPADGRILYIKEIKEGRLPLSYKNEQKRIPLEELTRTRIIKNSYLLIGTELSLIDVHVNRTPIGGKVILLKYIPGDSISLRKEQAPFRNERLTTIIDHGLFQIGVVQIASHLVRRIQSYIKQGQMVQIGQRLGIIKFGSQVDLIIPDIKNLKINVSVGDKVKAGVTVIAHYKSEERDR